MGSPRATFSLISLEETATGSSSKNITRSRGPVEEVEAGARRDTEPRQAHYFVGFFPVREVQVLVGADQEDRVVPAPCPQHVDGTGMVVDLDRAVGERRPREREPRLDRAVDVLVPRVGDDDHDHVVQPEPALRSVGERHVPDVRRVERPAEQAGHSITSVASPTSTSLPLRAPAARSAASSSSGGGGEPSTRNPRSVRRILNVAARGCGR